jgi:hypothetical protein
MVKKYACRAQNAFPVCIKKKSFLGNAQNFPLPAIVFFQDQTGKIPRKSWNPVSIFYSVEVLNGFEMVSGLSVNTNKTQLMVCGIDAWDTGEKIHGIEVVDSIRVLGIYIDRNLTI